MLPPISYPRLCVETLYGHADFSFLSRATLDGHWATPRLSARGNNRRRRCHHTSCSACYLQSHTPSITRAIRASGTNLSTISCDFECITSSVAVDAFTKISCIDISCDCLGYRNTLTV